MTDATHCQDALAACKPTKPQAQGNRILTLDAGEEGLIRSGLLGIEQELRDQGGRDGRIDRRAF
ncbi:MAG: hypothetical protein WBC44_16950, partial [Planctomycetaceae bacterium]